MIWHLGTLKIDTSMIINASFGLPNEPTLIGSNDEKQKYNLMQELIVEIYHLLRSQTILCRNGYDPFY